MKIAHGIILLKKQANITGAGYPLALLWLSGQRHPSTHLYFMSYFKSYYFLVSRCISSTHYVAFPDEVPLSICFSLASNFVFSYVLIRTCHPLSWHIFGLLRMPSCHSFIAFHFIFLIGTCQLFWVCCENLISNYCRLVKEKKKVVQRNIRISFDDEILYFLNYFICNWFIKLSSVQLYKFW